MNGTVPVITQSLSTIQAPDAAPEAVPGTEAAPPAKGSGTASAAAPVAGPPQGRDQNLDLARKFESVAQKEGRARKAEREAQAKLAGLTEREATLKAREAELDEALGDPVGYMLRNGKDPVEIAKRYAKPESEEEKRIRRLEERAEEREAEDAKKKTAWEKQQYQQAKTGAMRAFVGAITAKECPNLTALYEAHEVPALVDELLNRPSDPEDYESPSMVQAFREQKGRNPTDAEIRECIEYEAELRATKILERHRAPAPVSVATSPGGPTQDSPKSESGPNGISNKHAAGTSSPAKNPLSLQEKRKAKRRELTAALEAEAGDE